MVFDRPNWPLQRARDAARSSGGTAKPTSPAFRPRLLTLAIEPRMLFDGAAVATVQDAVDHANHDPVGQADARSVAPAASLHDGNVLAGSPGGDVADTDPDGDRLGVTGVAAGTPAGTPYGGIDEPVHGQYGTLLLRGDGSYDYVASSAADALAPGQTVRDVFTYTICDFRGGEDTATLTITLVGSGGNQPPVTTNDFRVSMEGEPVLDGQAVAGNGLGDHRDYDPDGTVLTVVGVVSGIRDDATRSTTGVDQPLAGQWGTLTMHSDGSYTYLPDAAARALSHGQNFEDNFTYTVRDAGGATANGRVTINVLGANASPVGRNDLRVIDEGQRITDGQAIRGNSLGDVADSDADGDSFDVLGVAAGVVTTSVRTGVGERIDGQFGALVIQSDGSYTYEPSDAARALAAGQQLRDVFTYQICDFNGGETRATITIVINGLDALTARPDLRSTDENTSISGNAVRGGATGDQPDVDQDGHVITVAGVRAGGGTTPASGGVGQPIQGALGTLTLQPDGGYTYVPGEGARALVPGQTVRDTFTYTIGDGTGLTATTTIAIDVTGVNAAPVARPDAPTTNEDTPTSGNVVTGGSPGDQPDSDADGDTVTVVGVRPGTGPGPAQGSVGTPVDGQFGTLTVNPDGSYTYVPGPGAQALGPGQSGQDVFSYTVDDGRGGTSTTTVTVTVTGLDDLIARPDLRSTDQNTSISGNAVTDGAAGDQADSDQGGHPITVEGVRSGGGGAPASGGVAQPIQGTLGVLTLQPNGSYTYAPGAAAAALLPGQVVRDTFTYTINDGNGLQSTSTIAIDVSGLNDAPVAGPDVRTTPEDAPVSGNVVTGGAPGEQADTDADGDTLTVVDVRPNGSTTPGQGGVGTPVNGQYGSVTINPDGSYTYVPGAGALPLGPGQTGQDVFTYTVDDGRGATSTTTITFNVTGIDALTARPDLRSTDQNTAVNGNAVTGGAPGEQADSDQSGHTIVVQGVRAGAGGAPASGGLSQPIEGTLGVLTLQPDGRYVYTPGAAAAALLPGQVVRDTFTYTIGDGNGLLSTTTIAIDVAGLNDAPVARPDTRVTDENTPISGNVVSGGAPGEQADSDADGDALTVVGVRPGSGSQPADGAVGTPVAGQYGSLTVNPDGSYTYIPGTAAQGLKPGESVQDTFTYTVADGRGGSSSTTIIFTVNGLNDAPVARPDLRTTDEDTPVSGNAVTGGAPGEQADTDADGDTLTVIGVRAGDGTQPAQGSTGVPVQGQYGTLTLNPDGSYTYEPGPEAQFLVQGQGGRDTFSYTVSDGRGGTSTTTIAFDITGTGSSIPGAPPPPPPPGSSPPVARPDVRTTDERTPITGNAVTGGAPGDVADSDADGDTLVVEGVRTGGGATPASGSVGSAIAGTWGTLTLNSDGSYSYAPSASAQALRPGQTVQDVFTYTVNDGTGGRSTGTITVNVNGLNDAPVANPDTNTIASTATTPATGNSVVGGSPGDRADTDPDAGDTLTVVDVRPEGGLGAVPGSVVQGSFGRLVMNPDGSYSYVVDRTNPTVATLATGQTLVDRFSYTVRDPSNAPATATLAVTVTGAAGGSGGTPGGNTGGGTDGTQPGGTGGAGGSGAGAAPPAVVTAPVIFQVPSGITGSAGSPALAPLPTLTSSMSVGPTPSPDDRLVMPADPFGLGAPLKVAGFVEEAPEEKSVPDRGTDKLAEAPVARKTAADRDDCVPTPKIKPKPKAARPTVFADVLGEKSKGFSEQLQAAKKRFKPPVRVVPREVAGRQC